jgi:hypothetical protein
MGDWEIRIWPCECFFLELRGDWPQIYTDAR